MATVAHLTKLRCDACGFEEVTTFETRHQDGGWQHVQVGYGRPGDPQLDFCSPGCASDWFARRSGHQLVRMADAR